MPNRTKKQKEENSAKICNRKKMDVKKEMSNVVLHITRGALKQTVTPRKRYNAPRLRLHSCRLRCPSLSHIKAIRKMAVCERVIWNTCQEIQYQL